MIIKQAKQDGNVGNGVGAATAMHVNWCKNLQLICARQYRDGQKIVSEGSRLEVGIQAYIIPLNYPIIELIIPFFIMN